MMPGQDEFETDDIYLAAYFLLAGCEIVRKRRQGPKVLIMFMNPAGSIKDLREAFYSGKAVGKLHDYAYKIIAMKQLVHEGV